MRAKTVMAILVAFMVLVVGSAFAGIEAPVKPSTYTVATRPAAAAGNANYLILVTDCESPSACATGGGSETLLLRSTGSAWVVVTGSGGGGGDGDYGLPTGGTKLLARGTDGTWYWVDSADLALTTGSIWIGSDNVAAEQPLASNVISMLQAASYSAINVLLGTVTKSVPQTQCGTVKTPVAGDGYPLWRAPVAVTITANHYITSVGGTSVVGQIQVCDGNADSCGNTQAVDTTAALDTNEDGVVTSGTAHAGDYVRMKVTTVNGEVAVYTACFDYTID